MKYPRLILLAGMVALPYGAYAQLIPTGDTPLGLQPASASVSVSGKQIELLAGGDPWEAMTTMGVRGMLVADRQGVYWWSTHRNRNGHYIWHSARQGTYQLADSDMSVVVK